MSFIDKDSFQSAYYSEAHSLDPRYAEFHADFDRLAADNTLEFKELTAILDSSATYDKKRIAYEILTTCFPDEAKMVIKPQPGLWDDANTYLSSVSSNLAAPFTFGWDSASTNYEASPKGWTDVLAAPVEFIDKTEDSFNSLSQISAYAFDSLLTTPSDRVRKNHFEASDRLDADYAAALALRSGGQIAGGLVGGVASLADTVLYASLAIPEGAGHLTSQIIASDSTSANDLVSAVTTETHGWEGVKGLVSFADNLLELSPLNLIAPIRGTYRTYVQDPTLDAAFDKLVSTDLTSFAAASASSEAFVEAVFAKLDSNRQRGLMDSFKALATNSWDAAWEKSAGSLPEGGALAELTAYDSTDEDWLSRGLRTLSMLITYAIPFTKSGKAKIATVRETAAKPFRNSTLPAKPNLDVTESPSKATKVVIEKEQINPVRAKIPLTRSAKTATLRMHLRTILEKAATANSKSETFWSEITTVLHDYATDRPYKSAPGEPTDFYHAYTNAAEHPTNIVGYSFIDRIISTRTVSPRGYWAFGGDATHATINLGRFYVSIRATYAVAYLRELKGIYDQAKREHRGFMQFKVPTVPERYVRADASVVYFEAAHQEWFHQKMTTMLKKHPEWTRGTTPLFAAQVLDTAGRPVSGLGFAMDPVGGESSFGLSIQSVLRDAEQKFGSVPLDKLIDTPGFVDDIIKGFERINIDVEHPAFQNVAEHGGSGIRVFDYILAHSDQAKPITNAPKVELSTLPPTPENAIPRAQVPAH